MRDLALYIEEIFMQQLEFVKYAIGQMQQSFPELYSRHVKGRRREFVAEHSPKSGSERGEVIGVVPVHLRVLWALAGLLYEHSPGNLSDITKLTSVSGALKSLDEYNTVALRAALQLGFWEVVSDSLQVGGRPNGSMLGLGSDWKVVLIKKPTRRIRSEAHSKYLMLTVMMEAAVASRHLAAALK